MVIGCVGCVFGLLGIFSSGLLFVPVAAVCGLFTVVSGAANGSLSIFMMAALCFTLAVYGFIVSPSLWLVAGTLGLALVH